ncbi:MAG: DUF1146 family protein [Bacillota bacterium]
MGDNMGLNALVNIVLSLACIGLAWWVLQAVKWDLFLRRPDSPQARLLIVLLALLVGSSVAAFLSDYLGWSLLLHTLFS